MTNRLFGATAHAYGLVGVGGAVRRAWLRRSLVAAVLHALTGFGELAIAAPGDLDTTFDGDGKVTTSIGSSDSGEAMAIQADGKIVVAGSADIAGVREFAVARYNSNGSLDTLFDGDGIVTTSVGDFADFANGVAIQSDGKIVAAGFTETGGTEDTDLALVRYNSDGSLDSSFSGDGIVTTPVGASDVDIARAVAIQSDGKIVVAGYSYATTEDYDLVLVRYNTDGTLDSSFAGDGIAVYHGVNDVAYAVAIQSDGKIVVAGYAQDDAEDELTRDFAILRYNTNGSLDTTFNGNGKLRTGFGGYDYARALAIQADGKIVAVGYAEAGPGFALVRCNTNGTLDSSFSGDGKLIGPIEGFALSVVLQSDDKLVVAGFGTGLSGDDFAVARYNTDGSFDTSFDADGMAMVDLIGVSVARAVSLQSDGKIVLAGQAQSDFAVVRLHGD